MKLKEFTWIEYLVVVVVIMLVAGAIGGAIFNESVEKPKQYQAWCKQTGNPNEITYQEWRSLERLEAEKRTVIVVKEQ
jgi:Tfp pilus assembly major pilin PilA